MTRGIVALAVAALCTACHRQPTPARATLPEDLVQPYVTIQQTLARDSIDGLSANAAAVSAAARRLGSGAATVDTDALALQQASNLPDARQRFGSLSEALVSYAKAQGRQLPAGVREAWCPMAAKPWLQRGSQIANPYYGKEMPTCGELK